MIADLHIKIIICLKTADVDLILRKLLTQKSYVGPKKIDFHSLSEAGNKKIERLNGYDVIILMNHDYFKQIKRKKVEFFNPLLF